MPARSIVPGDDYTNPAPGGSVLEEFDTSLYAAEAASAERRLAIQRAAISALAESETIAEAAPKLLQAIGEGIGWDFGSMWLRDRPGDAVRCEYTWSSPLARLGLFERATREASFAVGAGLPGRVWSSGEPAWITDLTTDPDFPRASFAEQSGLRSGLAFPILHRGEVLGVVELFTRELVEPDEALLADLPAFEFLLGQFIVREEAQRSLRESRDRLDTIERTEEALRESETRHRQISTGLQRDLLPPRQPEVPGLEVAVRFRALGEEAEIGGDFYDLFQTASGRWAVIVGDVSGKGTEAAALAALARYTVRATALHDDHPEHVLPMLNQAIGRQVSASSFCTAVYATIEPGELWSRLRIAAAGHPLPVLVRSHGGSRHAGGRGPLLGTFEHPRFEVEPADLARGDLLVLYTDGVIEAGTRPTEEGRQFDGERLAELLGTCSGLDAEQVAARVESRVAEAEGGDPGDDAAIVVLRAVPS